MCVRGLAFDTGLADGRMTTGKKKLWERDDVKNGDMKQQTEQDAPRARPDQTLPNLTGDLHCKYSSPTA